MQSKELDNKISAVESEIKELQNAMENEEDDTEKMKKRSTGVVFVVFQRPSDLLRVLQKQPGTIKFFLLWLKSLISCGKKDSKLSLRRWERAPEPTDIFW